MRALFFSLLILALLLLVYMFLPEDLKQLNIHTVGDISVPGHEESMRFDGFFSEEGVAREEKFDEKDTTIRKEAKQYITEITQHGEKKVGLDDADDFVGRDQPLSLLPSEQFEEATLNELKNQVELDAPLTVVREQEQVEITTAKDLLADSGGDLNSPLKILVGGDAEETTIGEVLENRNSPDSPISIIVKTEHLEVTTLKELMGNETLNANDRIKVIREPYRLQETTVGELLMGEKSVLENSIFYVRNVTEKDVQGLWGIVHNGLVKNFASGIAIRRAEEISEYQVDIPLDADERLEDQSSSFLGRMVDQKTRESYVYNYNKGSMGKNPDLLHPGQEVIIIGFTPEELYKIYEHFVTRSES